MKLQEGKFYKTAGGVVVGPMVIWDDEVEHPFQWSEESTSVFSPGGDIWREDGSSYYLAPRDWLVGEYLS